MGSIKTGAKAVVGIGIVVGGLYAANEIFDLGWELPTPPACFRDPSFSNCLPDWEIKNPLADDDPGFTSEVKGGVTAIEITPLDWPLFDRYVNLDPLEIKKEGDTKYEETSVTKVNTAMVGRLVALTFGEGGNKEAYIMAVDNNGTPEDATDDKMVPIDINKFDIISRSEVNTRTFPESLESDYDDCLENLYKGDSEYGGCTLSGIDGHDDNIPAEVLDNVRAQYIGFDGCVKDTMTIMSNLILSGITNTEHWEKQHADTVTIGDVAAHSLDERFSSLLGIPTERIYPVMATSAEFPNHAVEWTPDDDPDLQAVEDLSDGAYEAPDVYVPQFCFKGAWQTTEDPTSAINYITETSMVGPDFLNPDWYAQFEYTPVVVPAEISAITFNADGTFNTPNGIIKPKD